MNITFDEAIENHRKMWNWIADETEKRKIKMDKEDYFEENKIFTVILHDCFCCHYTSSDGDFADCDKCPIDWGTKNKTYACENHSALYYKWYYTDDYQSASKYAREIANLPAREEVRKIMSQCDYC